MSHPTLRASRGIRNSKGALIARMKRNGQTPSPAAIERELTTIRRAREIRANIAAMQQAGSTVEYHAVDVADGPRFEVLIADVYARYGRIDGVVHGAGIIEDKLIGDKTLESFERVLRPKIAGALALERSLEPKTLKFAVFFSFVSARYGNRGQCDYAAANEILNKLAIELNERWPARVVSINWGPWTSEGGMVSAELAERFEKAGVHLVSPAAGREAFIEELLRGAKHDAEVVWGGPIQAPITPYPLLDDPSMVQRSNGKVEVFLNTATDNGACVFARSPDRPAAGDADGDGAGIDRGSSRSQLAASAARKDTRIAVAARHYV